LEKRGVTRTQVSLPGDSLAQTLETLETLESFGSEAITAR
jgi:hypothetical protein